VQDGCRGVVGVEVLFREDEAAVLNRAPVHRQLAQVKLELSRVVVLGCTVLLQYKHRPLHTLHVLSNVAALQFSSLKA
jgi:Flp pilus assembly protein protease CpaA